MSDIILNPLAEEKTVKHLSEETHDLAKRYLTGKYQFRISDAGFRLEELNLPDETPPEIKHGKLAILTAERSRIDILPEERLAGNASNEQALSHRIPGYPGDGWSTPGSSISHITVDFGNAIRKGLKGLEKEIQKQINTDDDPHHKDFFHGLLDVITAMRIWINRYIKACEEMLSDPKYAKYHENLRTVCSRLHRVPENPPETFAEALQSFWSFFEFQRLCGNWTGLGRFDEILGNYLAYDLKNGIITTEEARELIAHFWIKGTEWCFGLRKDSDFRPGSGDAQYYQNIILGGIDKNGKQIENEVTFLVLDVIEELHISDYPVTVRLNDGTSEKLLRRIAEIQLLGGGIVSVYNENVIIRNLVLMGIPEEDARSFTNDGCWEIILPGQTRFSYVPKDFLIPFQEALFAEKTAETFDELYRNFLKRVRLMIEDVQKKIENMCLPGKKAPGDYPETPVIHADVVLSLLMPSCRHSGCSYTLDGTKWVFRAIHMAGLPDIANSLHAIKKNVFEKKIISLPELVSILKNNWQDEEALRLRFANSMKYYGNDDQEADTMLAQVLRDCAVITREKPKIGYITIPVGVSTFGREIAFAENRLATAFGKHAHEYLAPNLSPTPGTDKSPITAILNSYCRMDFSHTPNGCPLDLRLSAGIRRSPNAADSIIRLLQVFVKKGGLYLQIDTVDPDMLRKAQKDPDRFPNLAVRISGWSARFASLNKEWQEMIINRTTQEMI